MRLHLGHYHGVLKNWVRLQAEYPCLFFVADWHALTTDYEKPGAIVQDVGADMVIDWLAAGVDPTQATLFVQSQVPEHAELHLLLSMMTPLGWLERVPTYKDQQEKLADKDLSTYGFLGYPLLQAADILIYRAQRTCRWARTRCRTSSSRARSRAASTTSTAASRASRTRRRRRSRRWAARRRACSTNCAPSSWSSGDAEALKRAQALLDEQQNLPRGDRERLFGWLEGSGKKILVEPEALLTEASQAARPGRAEDVQVLRQRHRACARTPESVTKKIRTMPTDPARVKRTDPGNPEKCPVWQLHLVYSDEARKAWVRKGCTTAGIGCLECKQPVIDAVLAELAPMRERAQPYVDDPTLVKNIIADGCDKARKLATETMRDVREAMGLVLRHERNRPPLPLAPVRARSTASR